MKTKPNENETKAKTLPLVSNQIQNSLLFCGGVRHMFRCLGTQGTGDLEESSAMSHISVESARTGSWSGSVVGGFGFVDYPAGIPQKQWVSQRNARAVYMCKL